MRQCRVAVVSLGCDKNLVDSERMLSKLRHHGYELVGRYEQADVGVINTCGFIQAAKEEAIETILDLAACKEDSNTALQKIIVTGCLAQRYKQEIAKEFPEVDAVIGIADEKDIVGVLDAVLEGTRLLRFSPKRYMELRGERVIATPPYTSYLKIAEGCSNVCTYCAIPMIRGGYRSVPIEDVLAEAEKLACQGVTELNVIAQDTTRYGEDLYGISRLPELLRELCHIDSLRWIRLFYCYPERITEELIEVLATEDKIVKYLDMPIQHCDGEILRRMHREGDETMLRQLIVHMRERIPNLVLRTTLITGFPGESEEQFQRLAHFVEDMAFERLGCFAYSQEEGTAAAKFPDQIPESIKVHRADTIMEQQAIRVERFNLAQIGKTFEVLVEGYDEETQCYQGRTVMDAPSVDGMVLFQSHRELFGGEYANVTITDIWDYDLIGEVKE